MVAGRPQAEELVIQHVRQPRQRMPVARMRGGKGPLDAFEIYARLNIRILINVIPIVLDDKTKPAHPPEAGEGDDCQTQEKQIIAAHEFCGLGGVLLWLLHWVKLPGLSVLSR